ERLQAFMTIDETGARRTAERLDALPASQRGPPHGLPIAFKDLVATAGVRTTYGSLVHAHNTPAANELCVARTLEAGGVLIGKTTTPEFGFGATCQNRLAGPTVNPYDLTRTSGGSSGGSAVAVCTGMAAIAHGTDFGGSCRIPASLSGGAGPRPTAGRSPNSAEPLVLDDLHVPWMPAGNVEDVALLLSIVAGGALGDPTSLRADNFEQPALQLEPISRLRIAAQPDLGMLPIDSEVRTVLDAAVAKIAELYGHLDESGPN